MENMCSRMEKFIQKLLQKLLINITFKIKKGLRNEWMGMQHSPKHIVLPKIFIPEKKRNILEKDHTKLLIDFTLRQSSKTKICIIRSKLR